jgi:putative sigma-54 modulation protein
MKVHTESVHFHADRKLIDFVDQKVSKLNLFFDKIIEAHVTLKTENAGQIKDKVAEISLQVPGEVIFCKDTDKTFEGAVDSSVASLKRQLIKYKEKSRAY